MPAPDVILHDLACTACGYNLRGLDADAHCPECNQPVQRSLGGRLLRFADRRWLERLSFGLWLMHRSVVAACLAVMLLSILGGVISLILYTRGAMSGYDLAWWILGSIAAAVVGSAVVAGSIGVFLASQPDPSGTRRSLPLRPITRPLLVLLFPSVAAVLVFGVLELCRQIRPIPLGWWVLITAGQSLQAATLATWLNRVDRDVDMRGYETWWDATPDRRALRGFFFRTSHRGADGIRFVARFVWPPFATLIAACAVIWPVWRLAFSVVVGTTGYQSIFLLWTMGRTVACVRNELIESNARQ